MAILVRGSTRCPICGEIIAEGDPAVAFPPFVPNQRDPLFFFSDAAFHERCLDDHPDGAAARKLAAEVRERSEADHLVCVVCGELIRDPDDFLGFGYLTGDSELAASRFNYVQLHRSHVDRWPDLPKALEALEQLRDSGKWEGDWLPRLIGELREHSK